MIVHDVHLVLRRASRDLRRAPRWWRAAVLAIVALASSACQPTNPRDAGPEDAGIDGGLAP